jgi:transcriptional regulator with XRE-family HTH domain
MLRQRWCGSCWPKLFCDHQFLETRCLFATQLKSLKPKPKGYPNEIITLGDHLRKKRLDLGLTQEEIAPKIKASKASIASWEMNRYEPEVPYIPRIVSFLEYFPYLPTCSFAAWLRQCRECNGYSQERLASMMGSDESTVAAWERGTHSPNPEFP